MDAHIHIIVYYLENIQLSPFYLLMFFTVNSEQAKILLINAN